MRIAILCLMQLSMPLLFNILRLILEVHLLRLGQIVFVKKVGQEMTQLPGQLTTLGSVLVFSRALVNT